jgi:cysteine desulfurase
LGNNGGMFWKKKRIYLDYAAATFISKGALRKQKKASELFANPSAIHKVGVDAKASLEDSRKKIAVTLGCRAREVVFTSGGTEANNLAILGFARALENKGVQLSKTHWVTSKIEHPSVLECFKELERCGAEVSYIPVNEEGIIKPEALKSKLKKNTVFVSIGWANSEIGVVQPMHALSKVLRDRKEMIILHCDAGQAPLYLTSIVHGLGVDLLTLDSGKLYGPRGIGFLYKKSAVDISPILFGGSQEHGLRPGSENVPLAAGFAKALQELNENRKSEADRLSKIRNFFIEKVEINIDGAIINGSKKSTLPNVVNVSVPNINSEYIALALDHAGISISTKSSCLESEEDESHVVKSLTGEDWRAKNTLRFSFGNDTRVEDVTIAIRELIGAVERYNRLDT